MVITVSISQFRQHIAEYISKVKEGNTIILKDEKKDQQVVQLAGKKIFNPQTFEVALNQAAGIFSANNHPEWKTKHDVLKWVEKERKTADRQF